MMPELLEESRAGDRLTIRLRVPPGLDLFNGHFPGFPIVPGVVQIDWAVRLARRHFARLEECIGVDAFKCRAPVLPGARLLLALGYEAAGPRLDFAYSQADQPVSSGTILFR
jgi:3-hydroxymyristoyl/3-hydroxydecanoyl-(acyl carrier protein) dehydratase